MRFRLALILLVSLWSIARPANACLNDRDSRLAGALKRVPGVQEAISGRFERNPPLFYTMRAARVEKELAAHPEQLALYDDIAVALDRLHRDPEAIAWMAKKRAVLEKVAPKEDLRSPDAKEHWYSYHANLGTFQAHHALGSKGQLNRAALVQARDHIARAVAIKPDAHFGREPVQLAVLEWVLDGRDDMSLGAYLDGHISLSRIKIPQGLAGLVVLGAAWESVDIFAALTWQRDFKRFPVGGLVQLRVEELQRAGRKSLSKEEPLYNPGQEIDPWVRERYQFLRTEAEQWHDDRMAYLLPRLQAGRHPDTDPTFWNDWHPRPAPSLGPPWYRRLFGDDVTNFFFLVFVLPGIVIFGIVRFRKWRYG